MWFSILFWGATLVAIVFLIFKRIETEKSEHFEDRDN